MSGLSVSDRVLLDLVEHFGNLDDSDDAPFGEFARVSYDQQKHQITVLHESEPWGIRVILAGAAESDALGTFMGENRVCPECGFPYGRLHSLAHHEVVNLLSADMYDCATCNDRLPRWARAHIDGDEQAAHRALRPESTA